MTVKTNYIDQIAKLHTFKNKNNTYEKQNTNNN